MCQVGSQLISHMVSRLVICLHRSLSLSLSLLPSQLSMVSHVTCVAQGGEDAEDVLSFLYRSLSAEEPYNYWLFCVQGGEDAQNTISL